MESLTHQEPPRKSHSSKITSMSDSLLGGGETGRLIRSIDWSKTPVGPIEEWPQSLKTSLSICLGSKFPMFVWWGKELTVFYNDAYIPFTGLKHPKFLGRTAREQWSEIWNDLEPLTNQVLNTAQATWAESMLLYMNRKGFLEETYFTFSYSPIRDESGNVGGIINPCQETTERIISERRLRLLHELGAEEVRSILDLTSSVSKTLKANNKDIPFFLIYILDKDKTNAFLIDSSGIKERSAPKSILLDGSQNDQWQLLKVHQTAKANKLSNLQKFMFEDLPALPYQERPNSAYVQPIMQPGQDTPTGFLILGISSRLEFDERYREFFNLINKYIANQLSNINAIEEEKRRAEALLEIDRAKTAFFTNISHEFRTPLTLILGPIENALEQSRALSNEDLEMVRRNTLRLYRLVNSLLDYAQIESGKAKASFVPIDIALVTRDIASEFRSAAENLNLKYTINCPELSEKVFIDVEMWEKIVSNLLLNSIKYTHKGKIEVNLREENKFAILEVKDTGVGIPEKELPHIFDRFHRVKDTQGRSHEGVGIGLSLVKELVGLHKGSITVFSQINQGTSFILKIPFGSLHLPQDQVLSTKSNVDRRSQTSLYTHEAARWGDVNDEASLNKNHKNGFLNIEDTIKTSQILFVDDNMDLRSYIHSLLKPIFPNLVLASDGIEALKAIKIQKPDIIISDIMMPNMDGFQLVQELRKNVETNSIPIILLSARAGKESTVAGLISGVDDYLVKPFSAKELIVRVSNLLKNVSMRKEFAQNEHEKNILKETIKNKDEFLSIASHELKTPLTSLKIQLQLIDRTLKSKKTIIIDKFKRSISMAIKQTDHLNSLVEDLLDLSRIQAGRLNFHFEKINLSNLVEDNIERNSGPLNKAKCEINLSIEPDIYVLCDQGRIDQVLNNLLSNVIKYAANTTVEISLKRSDEEKVFLEVKDSGPGVPQADQEKIFERFVRSDQTKNISGLGIGLYISKVIILAHNGEIKVTSHLGKGARFIITLPEFD